MAFEESGGFAKWRSMELPRSIVVGHNAIQEVGDVCARLKLGRRALVVADKTTKAVAGDMVIELLGAKGFKVDEMLIEEADVATVAGAKEMMTAKGVDFALGVGGGRPIDVAKCASADVGTSFVSVPTAASHDGVVSSRASILGQEGKVSFLAQPPIAVIMDTAIIANSPYRLLAAGCGDIIANSTAVKDWILARNLRNETFSTYAASLSEMTAKMVIENASHIKPKLEESAWFVAKALVSSGVAMSIAGSSRPASGSEHKFSHALDKISKHPALHGEQCGVGTILMMYLHGGDWEAIRNALLTIGAPATAKALGATDDEIIEALVHAHEVNPERYTILGDTGLTYEAAERLAHITKVVA